MRVRVEGCHLGSIERQMSISQPIVVTTCPSIMKERSGVFTESLSSPGRNSQREFLQSPALQERQTLRSPVDNLHAADTAVSHRPLPARYTLPLDARSN